jgi:magnesium chelatase family protein
LLDRIDIHIEVKRTAYEDLENDAEEESSFSIKERVNRARDIQLDRYKNENIFFNSQLGASQIKRYCSMDKEAKSLVKDAFEAMNLSARAYHRIIKLARTIADLNGKEG